MLINRRSIGNWLNINWSRFFCPILCCSVRSCFHPCTCNAAKNTITGNPPQTQFLTCVMTSASCLDVHVIHECRAPTCAASVLLGAAAVDQNHVGPDAQGGGNRAAGLVSWASVSGRLTRSWIYPITDLKAV